MRVNVLQKQAYWDLRKPYDMYLPDSVSADDVEAELDTIQTRFRERIVHLGNEGTAWEFPGHYLHVRVFYVYLYSSALYTPELGAAISASLDGYHEWICELECYSVPGSAADGTMTTPVFLHGHFYMEEEDSPQHFASALHLAIDRSLVA